jgi:FKBP-type peptidyl-prolyl cis-trans isomerase SlyD
MKIEKNCVVSFHYDLSDETGQPIESSRERTPLAVLFGFGNVIEGIETALANRQAGDRFQVTVPPEQGYGPRREDHVQRVPKKYFQKSERLRPGVQAALSTKDGPRAVTVIKVGESVVDVDLNHPMAGKVLNFDIEITEVRAASEDEIAHGHAHAPGGHHH